MPDTFGKGLMDFWEGRSPKVTIRRDDDHVDELDMREYFSRYSEWPILEKRILAEAKIQGTVLDIGAGAGRHSLYLQDQGLGVHAIDISLLAVEVMKRRGASNVYPMDLRKLIFPADCFDAILMMGNNFGLAGTIEETKKVLKAFYEVSTHQARIIATIIDPYKTDNPAHLEYHKKNRQAGRPSGQVKIRVECNGEVGDWFSLLMVSAEELEEILQGTGWRLVIRISPRESTNYGVVLAKE